ncbi:hypothetical protein SLEP1_g40044 [Rubroshorea leprosula]|uniref:Uncharacterized protein n=1 Tax=Rubroshorea leprosula TaxID=152421 RepID=A0AAV5L288_9ROSI|nr:hypothetical protein SLEP1_g40044 [Rubroshorea leprosula]
MALAWGNGVNNNGANNFGIGFGSQNYGQSSGSNHVNGGMWSVSGAYGGHINVGPGARGVHSGFATVSVNTLNGQANLWSG